MPELPEVETVARGLKRRILGRRIKSVSVINPSVIRGQAGHFTAFLAGKTIQKISRHGKSIYIHLIDSSSPSVDHEARLRIHLGMTGVIMFEPAGMPLIRHTHVILRFEGIDEELRYRDIRRFGCMEITAHKKSSVPDAWLASRKNIFRALRRRKGMVKPVLMGQKAMAGLGNIYVDESLYRAGIHPREKLENLTDKSIWRLCDSIRNVLGESIRQGGTTFRDYRTAEGKKGGFQQLLKIYGRTGEICSRCRNQFERMVVGGRSTHYCQFCQRLRHKS